MRIYNMHDAKTNLSRLVDETVNGGSRSLSPNLANRWSRLSQSIGTLNDRHGE